LNEYEDIHGAVEGGDFKEVESAGDVSTAVMVSEDATKIDIVTDEEIDSEMVRKRILELKDMVEDSNFELAEMLHKAYSMSLFRKWNYTTWEDYCEQESCIGVRKANYLKKIWEWFAVKWGNDKELLNEVKHLGWTRAMMLTGVLMPSTKEKWIPLAKDLSCKRLEEKIREYRKEVRDGKASVGESDEVDLKTKLKVELYNDQIVVVNDAMDRAKELTNSDSKGVHLAAICQDFLSTNNWQKNSKDSLISYFSKIEHMMGLKIVAVNPGSKEIVYGAAFLDDLLKKV
jgi:hypothetical protein